MRWLLVAAVVFVGVVVVGVGLLGSSSTDSNGSPESPAAGLVDERTTGSPDSGGGAADRPDPRADALSAVAMTGEVVSAGFISRRMLIESFTTERFGAQLADETSAQVSALLLELGARDADPASLRVIEQPLTAQTVSETTDRAVVDVWSVLVVAVPEAGPGRQVWRTVRVELELADRGWLVDSWASTLGPTPALAPQAMISDTESVLGVLAWPPVADPVEVS